MDWSEINISHRLSAFLCVLMMYSVLFVWLKNGVERLFIELDFNEAGVLADSCVCACCHGFQLSSGAVQRQGGLSWGWGTPPLSSYLWSAPLDKLPFAHVRYHSCRCVLWWLFIWFVFYTGNNFSCLCGCSTTIRQLVSDVTFSISISCNDSVFLWGLFCFARIWVRGALADVYMGLIIQRRGYEVIKLTPISKQMLPPP